MELQINPDFTDQQPAIDIAGMTLLFTPPIDGDYWWLRVPLTDEQAIVAFPKFGTIGIGFQSEEDWNTNLPYTCSPRKIFNHISHNKGDENIPDSDCITAIELIQQTIAKVWPDHDEENVRRMRKREND